jgi:hypothetical protein
MIEIRLCVVYGTPGEEEVTDDLRSDASDSGNGKRKGTKRAISIRLTKTAGRVGGTWREGEILEGAIESDINGHSIWAAGENGLRAVLMLGSSILWM